MPGLEQVLGPVGALALALIGLGALARAAWKFVWDLWEQHKASDERERQDKREAEERLDQALVGLKEHTVVTDRAVALTERIVDRLDRQGGNHGH